MRRAASLRRPPSRPPRRRPARPGRAGAGARAMPLSRAVTIAFVANHRREPAPLDDDGPPARLKKVEKLLELRLVARGVALGARGEVLHRAHEGTPWRRHARRARVHREVRRAVHAERECRAVFGSVDSATSRHAARAGGTARPMLRARSTRQSTAPTPAPSRPPAPGTSTALPFCERHAPSRRPSRCAVATRASVAPRPQPRAPLSRRRDEGRPAAVHVHDARLLRDAAAARAWPRRSPRRAHSRTWQPARRLRASRASPGRAPPPGRSRSTSRRPASLHRVIRAARRTTHPGASRPTAPPTS